MRPRKPWQSQTIADHRTANLAPFLRHVFHHWYERARLVDLAGGDPDHEWAAALRAGPLAIAGHIEGRASARTETGRW